MATITDLPYELLCYIILLLVQSPGGAADFARIVSVCRASILFAQDERILKLVNFDIKMKLENFKQYQHRNSLLVKCSEAGNVGAQFLLGKVIMVSSSQLLLCEWQKAGCDFRPCDLAKLRAISCILATNVSAQEDEVSSFVSYFIPRRLSTSKFSKRRLVHFQLVKLFLRKGSHHDLAEMFVFLKNYVRFFTSNPEEDSPRIKCIEYLGFYAESIRRSEKHVKEVVKEVERGSGCSENTLNGINNHIDRMKSTLAEYRAQTLRFFELNFGIGPQKGHKGLGIRMV